MRTILIATLLALIFAPVAVRAQDIDSDPYEDVGFRGWGVRVGPTMGPDQLHFGAHLDFGNFARHVRFQPNFELGLGDGLTWGALNFEASYRFVERWEAWSPYLGGGLGMNFVDIGDDGLGDGTQTDLGLNALGGIEKGLASGDRFFTELKLGLIESPDAKLTFGWTFYH